MSRFFIDRPIAATVLSTVIVIVGAVALLRLPIAQYPEVAPPVVSVVANYPGANAAVVADTVANPIEQEVNGVENMIYMSSRSTNDGQMTLDVTFRLGTNLDMAQVLVQNRVSIALAKLPEEVKRLGVTTKKKSPSILLCVNLISEMITDPVTGKVRPRHDLLYLSNYATTDVKDALARVQGVGDVTFLGPRDYSMRIWLDPTKLAARNLNASDVVNAVREQNVQVAAGRLGQPPTPPGQSFQLVLTTVGRLETVEQFRQIVVKTADDGSVVYLGDVVDDSFSDEQRGVELGAKNYDVASFLDEQPSITMAVFQLPGSNALDTANRIRSLMKEIKLPDGVEYRIAYDTTVFIDESIHEVYKTLFEAIALVFLVVLVFLQDWRTTLIPMVAVPVCLIGTFAFMTAFGFSLNNLSLFGLVLAIGILVDDAIVVVENVERWMAEGLSPRDATIKAMGEITSPILATSLVLCAVFVPTAFIPGITGQFYRQFALTIAASTVISTINALTLSPALAALLMRPHKHGERRNALPTVGVAVLGGLAAYLWLLPMVLGGFGIDSGHGSEAHASEAGSLTQRAWVITGATILGGALVGWLLARPVNLLLRSLFSGFNWVFDRLTRGYGFLVRTSLRLSIAVLLLYGGLIALTYAGFRAVPTGFIPSQDKGYLVVNAQLPDAASLERTEEVIRRMTEIASSVDGIAHTLTVPGYSILTGSNISNVGGMYLILEPFEERAGRPELSANAIARKLRTEFYKIQDAVISVFGAPPVDGLGTTGGFKMQVQDRGALGPQALESAVANMVATGNAQPGLTGLFSSFTANQPQIFLDVDRIKAKRQGVALSDVFDTLQAYLGSSYVNDITLFNRNWQVNVQAGARYRLHPDDIGRLKVRNRSGEMVPLNTIVAIREATGPAIVNHYNLYPSAEINGTPSPGISSGQAIAMMDRIAATELPSSMRAEWTDLSFQQIEAAKDPMTIIVFPLAVVLVFLVLAFQYESWSLPMAIILIVPMGLLSAITGLWLTSLDNDVFTQIGLVVLIGLAAKNAILIVEFAKQREDQGLDRTEATVSAATIRLRPILMTSFAFIFGVLPLVLATGAGAEMRVAIGIAVFAGMIGVTIFGLFLTPVFYFVVRVLASLRKAR